MTTYLIPHNIVPALVVAGNARLVFHNPKTGKSRAYHITKHKEKVIWYVKQIIPNEDEELYLGKIVGTKFWENYTPEAQAFKTILHLVSTGSLSPEMEVMHCGLCCRCGRELTDPLSIELGIGPTCRSR